MRVFVTGATGYIGGTVAAHLIEKGHQVIGLTRSGDRAAALRERGIEPWEGSLDDTSRLAEAARRSDAVVNAASSDHAAAVHALLDALSGTGKPFVHTSGASIVADRAAGEPGDRVYDEETPLPHLPERAARVALDRAVRDAAGRGVRSVVLCPGLVYGGGRGVNRESTQVPRMIEQGKSAGVVPYIGRGENAWSNAHVEDVADAYVRALERGPAGSFFFVENGEASFRAVAEWVAAMLGGGCRASGVALAEAERLWGPSAGLLYGSNCRLRSARARGVLGWSPQGPTLEEECLRGHYRRVHRR
jgi:nucleoside-diphosphate-sugar epimerase